MRACRRLRQAPAHGIDFVQVHDPVSALLYPGRWFPIALPGLFTDRFTAEIHVTVPTGETVVGSGGEPDEWARPRRWTNAVRLRWEKPGFPGSLVVGKFLPAITRRDSNVRVYLTQQNQARVEDFATTVAQAFAFDER